MGGIVPVGWGEAHHSWRERMTSIYPVIRKLKIIRFIVYETQSMIDCTDIPHGFAKGGLHPTLQELAHVFLGFENGNLFLKGSHPVFLKIKKPAWKKFHGRLDFNFV